MKHLPLKYFALATMLLLSALPAMAELPKRDLTIELRQVEEGEGSGYAVSTQAHHPLLAPQQVQVRNGEKASLRMGTSIPMHWVQSVTAQSATLAASGAAASSNSGGVTNAVTWMDAGQSIKVHPRWPGAKQLVTVDIEVQSARIEARVGEELPEQSRSQAATTVSAPLGQWVTIASTGSSPQRGLYSSEATNDIRRLLQIRVLTP